MELQATLNEEETKFVMEVGINVLMASGSVPFITKQTADTTTVVAGTNTPQ